MSLSLLWELSSIKKSWVLSTEQLTAAADNIGVKPTCVKWSHLGLELPQSAGGCWALTSQWGSRASQGQSKHWQLKHSHTLTLGARNNQPVTSLSLRQTKAISNSWQPSLGPVQPLVRWSHYSCSAAVLHHCRSGSGYRTLLSAGIRSFTSYIHYFISTATLHYRH